MTEAEYIEQAMAFNSRAYFVDKVIPQELEAVLIAANVATVWADRVKRALFYGIDLPVQRTSSSTSTDVVHDPELSEVVHGILGLFTEAGELMQHLSDVVSGSKSLDRVNVIEELGDIEWYAACLHQYLGSTPTQAREANIAKLSKRYPGKVHTAQAAEHRDLAAERAVLESKIDEEPHE